MESFMIALQNAQIGLFVQWPPTIYKTFLSSLYSLQDKSAKCLGVVIDECLTWKEISITIERNFYKSFMKLMLE